MISHPLGHANTHACMQHEKGVQLRKFTACIRKPVSMKPFISAFLKSQELHNAIYSLWLLLSPMSLLGFQITCLAMLEAWMCKWMKKCFWKQGKWVEVDVPSINPHWHKLTRFIVCIREMCKPCPELGLNFTDIMSSQYSPGVRVFLEGSFVFILCLFHSKSLQEDSLVRVGGRVSRWILALSQHIRSCLYFTATNMKQWNQWNKHLSPGFGHVPVMRTGERDGSHPLSSIQEIRGVH